MLIIYILFGCSSSINFNLINQKVDSVLQNKKNAIDVLEKTFETKRIVLIGSGNHSTINDSIFLNKDNLRRLYNKGLRYILCEGGLKDNFIYEKKDLEKKYVAIFYPWENVGAVYSPVTLNEEVLNVNLEHNEKNSLKIIGLESGRELFVETENNADQILNYRDKYMYDVAKKFIDSENYNVKFLVLCGSFHGSKKPIKENGKILYPLGYYLNNYYKDSFETYEYLSFSSFYIESTFYDCFLDNENWKITDFKQKFLNRNDIIKINKYIPIFVARENRNYNNFFVDKNSIYGIKYGYILKDESVNKEIINQTFIINDKLKSQTETITNSNNNYNNTAEAFFETERFIKNIYYLKLFYGDAFTYKFWNPEESLIHCLKKILNVEVTTEKINYDRLEEYQNLLSVMYYLKFSKSKDDALYYYKKGKDLIEKARKIMSDEIWFDYWHAYMNFKMEEYQRSLDYCKKLLNNPLVLCSQVYPEILELTINSSEKLNLSYSQYENEFKNLKNEFNIDISAFSLFRN